MSPRKLAVLAALVTAAVLAPAIAAAAKDDPAAIKAGRDALKKELVEKKCFVYFDLSYFVDAPKLKETRWEWKDPPPFQVVDEKGGGQFFATWIPSAGSEWGIEFKTLKLPHYEMHGSSKTVFNQPFSNWGKTVPVSKLDDMVEGFYEDWLKESTDAIKEKCSAPKKQKTGPAEWFCSGVATDKDLKKRVRKNFYGWGTSGAGVPCTWIAIVTFAEKFIDNEEILDKAKDLMQATREITDKRAK